MLILDQPIYKRVYAITQQHNALQTRARHRIDKNRYAMLRTVTELSIAQARRVVQLPTWADSDQLPTCYTNRRELSTLVGCSERTVYNCLSVLEDAGLVQKILHGRQNDFELVLHPWIVFGLNFMAPALRRVENKVENAETQILKIENASPPPGRRQNLPPISSEESKETVVISSNSGVDFVEKWSRLTFTSSRQNPLQVDYRRSDRRTNDGNSEGETPNYLPFPPTKENSAPGHHRTHKLLSLAQLLPTPESAPNDTNDGDAGEERPRLTNATAPAPHSLPTSHRLQPSPDVLARELTVKFWKLAKETFWPNDYIAEGCDYEKRLLNLVWTDVMGSFRGCNTASEITARYFLRESQLQLATNYATKHGWTGFLPPPLYFSISQFRKEKTSGQRGSFHWTYEWVKSADSKKKERYRQDQLKRALHSVIAQKAPRGLKNGRDMSRIQLYQYWHNRLGRLGDPRTLDAFDEQVLQHIPQL